MDFCGEFEADGNLSKRIVRSLKKNFDSAEYSSEELTVMKKVMSIHFEDADLILEAPHSSCALLSIVTLAVQDILDFSAEDSYQKAFIIAQNADLARKLADIATTLLYKKSTTEHRLQDIDIVVAADGNGSFRRQADRIITTRAPQLVIGTPGRLSMLITKYNDVRKTTKRVVSSALVTPTITSMATEELVTVLSYLPETRQTIVATEETGDEIGAMFTNTQQRPVRKVTVKNPSTAAVPTKPFRVIHVPPQFAFGWIYLYLSTESATVEASTPSQKKFADLLLTKVGRPIPTHPKHTIAIGVTTRLDLDGLRQADDLIVIANTPAEADTLVELGGELIEYPAIATPAEVRAAQRAVTRAVTKSEELTRAAMRAAENYLVACSLGDLHDVDGLAGVLDDIAKGHGLGKMGKVRVAGKRSEKKRL